MLQYEASKPQPTQKVKILSLLLRGPNGLQRRLFIDMPTSLHEEIILSSVPLQKKRK